MSLTSFLTIKEVRDKFTEEFPLPKFDLRKEILAPPLTNHYSLIGTAFDYLLRFYLKYLNPKAITGLWVAEYAPERFLFAKSALVIDGDKHRVDIEESFKRLSNKDRVLFKNIQEIIEQAKENYSTFLKTGEIDNNLIKSALLLAQLDPIFRALYVDENIGKVDSKDIEDLKKLISIINPKIFKARKICLLNPTFGKASELVGGADADLLIDGKLIDIKTTKFLKLERKIFNQLLGYYILSKISGIGNPPCQLEIMELGIYFPRYGELYTFKIKDVINENQLPNFIKWFKKKAKEIFERRF